jgi:hypothetical protein
MEHAEITERRHVRGRLGSTHVLALLEVAHLVSRLENGLHSTDDSDKDAVIALREIAEKTIII